MVSLYVFVVHFRSLDIVKVCKLHLHLEHVSIKTRVNGNNLVLHKALLCHEFNSQSQMYKDCRIIQ